MDQYRKSPRAGFLNYDGGKYFVTICTRNHRHYFGEIINGVMHLSNIGNFLTSHLEKAHDFCSDIEIPLFVVMPNHIHAIICVTCRDMPPACFNDTMAQRSPNPSLRADPTCRRHVPTLSRYINSLKGSVTKFANANALDFGWQSRYHDHYIRGNQDGNNIADYIENNVAQWANDCFYD